MARSQNPLIIIGDAGQPLAGVSVQTNNRPSGTPAAVFTTETGGTAAANPGTTDAHGRLVQPQWVDRGAYSSVCSGAGLTTFTANWDAVPGVAGGIDAAALSSAIAFFKPGDLRFTAIPTLETGWLLADGSSVLRATYPALFAAIGTAYGSVDGTHFNLPDYRERTPVGAGLGVAFAAKGGEASHALTTAELAAHSHGVTDPTHVHGNPAPGYYVTANATVGNAIVTTVGSGTGVAGLTAPGNFSYASVNAASSTGVSIQNAGSGTAHNNREPFCSCNVWVKT